MKGAWTGYVKKRARPKARPRVTKMGNTYMPPEYMAAREEFGWLWKALNPPSFGGLLELHLGFHTDGVQIVLIEVEEGARPKHVRADIDNLVGFVMEVAEDIGVVGNDRQIVKVVATVLEGEGSKRAKERE